MKIDIKSLFSPAASTRIGRLILATAAGVAFLVGSSIAGATNLDRTGTLWEPVIEWSLENFSWSGNPFDLVATATFTHAESGEQRVTPMYYDGNDTWKFRFTATRTGAWTFRTASADSDLDGKQGNVQIAPNPDANAKGFIVAHGNKFAKQVGTGGKLEAFVPNIYMNMRKFGNPEKCGWTAISPTFSDPGVFEAYLDEVEEHGSNTAFALIANQWFKAGAPASSDHKSVNPDPETFRALERAIQQAQRRGMHLHIWAWGDEARRWTPVGVGGVNGVPDRRVQRYIAARLGPLPAWTMSYGFDLGEWASPKEVESWANYINAHSGWERLLSARENGSFPDVKALPVAANDDKPTSNFYQAARARLNQSPERPVRFERRFSYLRDGVWDMKTTRRAFWQFTLAGGAAAIWGHYPPNCSAYHPDNYPAPRELRTHREFWKTRFLLEMEPAPGLSDDSDTRVLRAGDGHAVFYRENASTIHLDLSGMKGSLPAIAVDAKKTYAEIDLGAFDAQRQTWQAPYSSDWAIAVGSFSGTGELPTVTVETRVSEGNDLGFFRVNRIGINDEPLHVRLDLNSDNGTSFDHIEDVREIPAGADFIDILAAPDPGDLPAGDETVSLSIESDPAYIVGEPGNATVIVRDDPLRHWLFTYYSAEELLDPAIGGLFADTNGDGIANLLKFALGGNPKAASQSELPSLEESDGRLTLVFRRPRDSGLNYTVQINDGLGSSWMEGDDRIQIVVIPDPEDPDNFEKVLATDRTPVTDGRQKFMRLKVDRS